MKKFMSIVMMGVMGVSLITSSVITYSASEVEDVPTLTPLEAKELEASGSLPEEYVVKPKERCYYECTYYKYTTVSKTSRQNNVYLRDHPSWGWKYDNTKRSFCTGKISKTISTSISIGGKGFSVGVGYAPQGSGTFDCVSSVNKSGKTKVRPTIRGDKYVLKQKIQKINTQTGKVLSTSYKTSGVTVNEQLGLRYV